MSNRTEPSARRGLLVWGGSSESASLLWPASSRLSSAAYWAATVIIAWELLFGGVWDILRIPHVYGIVVEDLGYPEYFLVILGVWKLLGGLTLLVPGYPRLKEWAYAGAFFNYSGAVVSHIVVGESLAAWWGPAVFGVILMASWGLRPASRRDFVPS